MEIAMSLNGLEPRLSKPLADAAGQALRAWQDEGKMKRLWARDAGLWTGADEARWMGWLDVIERQSARAPEFTAFQKEIKAAGFSHALLLGMGGSSLCPDVLRLSFEKVPGFPELLVLDSTDPEQILSFERRIEPAKTLFIVSSKSGGTLEPNILMDYFWAAAQKALGAGQAGAHFIAVTDPGSALEKTARGRGFRRVFHGEASIGGRYSALSDFGMVPAAVMGLDVAKFLGAAHEMQEACKTSRLAENPGAVLGTILGAAALRGRDKVTFISSPGISDLGAWLEQLLAESTGKQGKGIIPVDREPSVGVDIYGSDRLFVYLRLEAAPDAAQDAQAAALEKGGQPVVRVSVADVYRLGQEFFRWEIATAVAGSLLGINPFNQPDVEASKIATKALMDEYEKTGSFPKETPVFEEGGIKLFTDEAGAKALAGSEPSLAGYLRAHLARWKKGDYVALLAYLEMNAEHEKILEAARRTIVGKTGAAVCLGFGPRFQHSTGQAYKGGPNTGVFLQITAEPAQDAAVPGKKYAFGAVKAAQARGDFAVLSQRGRRLLRVHLPGAQSLSILADALRRVVG
ncbi:MAG TPA: bifunctional transaldolase/phosoglucose isomerase [Elusimicrobiota bacterium]|nr:bifunctional transaldolase/phosoglucose isomerase [Elusimicrobiota bacterium]